MIFATVPIVEADGGRLVHAIRAGEKLLRKGHLICVGDIILLQKHNISTATIMRLEAGDVDENEAAQFVGRLLNGPNIEVGRAFTGRVNIHAGVDGLFALTEDHLFALNRIDEGITVATLNPFERVSAGQLICTIKIIPFAVERSRLDALEKLIARDGVPFRVHAFKDWNFDFVATTLPNTSDKVLDKGLRVSQGRVESLGGQITSQTVALHEQEALTTTLASLSKSPARAILILGASAITDRRDVIPAAVEAAGGTVDQFGIPVDPGNLLLLGKLEGKVVIGLPGCARSPKLNGFDWVLERLMAGLEVTREDFIRMSAGGLLKEIASRPQPRESDTPLASSQDHPRIAAIVLAAGQSRRMGESNKLLADIDGSPMIAQVLQTVQAAQVDKTYVVTGHEADEVRTLLQDPEVTFIHNPNFAAGLSTSLMTGFSALGPEFDGALVCLGDMPTINTDEINQLIEAFDPENNRGICVPTHAGKRGNPVLWARQFFNEMSQLRGDVGAKHLIGDYGDQVFEVEMKNNNVLVDVDTPEVLKAVRQEFQKDKKK